MAFLKFYEVKKLAERLARFFTRGKASKKRKRERLFYALEPLKGLVHIILGDDMLKQVLSLLSAGELKLKQFSNGAFYRELAAAKNSTVSLTLDTNYQKVHNWGGNFMLKFRAYFNASKVTFDLIQNGSEEGEITYPDLSSGTRFSSQRDFLDRLNSRTNAEELITLIGIPLDPEFRSRVLFELQQALESVQRKLCPMESIMVAT